MKALAQILPPDDSDSAMVARVCRRIVDALPTGTSEGYSRHLACYHWEFVAARSHAVRAVVLPGGKVFVTTGATPSPARHATSRVVVSTFWLACRLAGLA